MTGRRGAGAGVGTLGSPAKSCASAWRPGQRVQALAQRPPGTDHDQSRRLSQL